MMTPHRVDETTGRTVWWLLAVLVALATGLRLYQLNSGLWFDEILTLIEAVRPPLTEILTHFPSNNDHPLYSVLAHVSISGFGEHAWSLRLPAALFGIATVPMLWWFGTRVTTRFEALSAAALLAVSYHHIWFSQNARGYTILLFWTLLASYLFVVGLKDNELSVFLGYGVVSALGVYTHLTMVFIVASHAVIVIWLMLPIGGERRRIGDWRYLSIGFALAGLLSLCFYAPLLFDVQAFFVKTPKPKEVATPTWAFWAALQGLKIGFAVGWGVVIAGLLFISGCWSYWRLSE